MARYYLVLLICFAVYPITTNGHAEDRQRKLKALDFVKLLKFLKQYFVLQLVNAAI